MAKIKTTTEIIDALGGNSHVARLTGTTPKLVSGWRAYGKFPSNTFIVLKEELRRARISAPNDLWSMREHPDRRRAAK